MNVGEVISRSAYSRLEIRSITSRHRQCFAAKAVSNRRLSRANVEQDSFRLGAVLFPAAHLRLWFDGSCGTFKRTERDS